MPGAKGARHGMWVLGKHSRIPIPALYLEFHLKSVKEESSKVFHWEKDIACLHKNTIIN